MSVKMFGILLSVFAFSFSYARCRVFENYDWMLSRVNELHWYVSKQMIGYSKSRTHAKDSESTTLISKHSSIWKELLSGLSSISAAVPCDMEEAVCLETHELFFWKWYVVSGTCKHMYVYSGDWCMLNVRYKSYQSQCMYCCIACACLHQVPRSLNIADCGICLVDVSRLVNCTE